MEIEEKIVDFTSTNLDKLTKKYIRYSEIQNE